MSITQPKDPLTVTFKCAGNATGKMRNDLDVANAAVKSHKDAKAYLFKKTAVELGLI